VKAFVHTLCPWPVTLIVAYYVAGYHNFSCHVDVVTCSLEAERLIYQVQPTYMSKNNEEERRVADWSRRCQHTDV